MAIAKSFNSQKQLTSSTGSKSRQVIIFGTLISSIVTASAVGYALYVSNSFFQELFLKFTSYSV